MIQVLTQPQGPAELEEPVESADEAERRVRRVLRLGRLVDARGQPGVGPVALAAVGPDLPDRAARNRACAATVKPRSSSREAPTRRRSSGRARNGYESMRSASGMSPITWSSRSLIGTGRSRSGTIDAWPARSSARSGRAAAPRSAGSAQHGRRRRRSRRSRRCPADVTALAPRAARDTRRPGARRSSSGVPHSTTFPWSRNTTRSASRTVDSR